MTTSLNSVFQASSTMISEAGALAHKHAPLDVGSALSDNVSAKACV